MILYVTGLVLIAAVAWTVSRPFFAPPRRAARPARSPDAEADRWRKRRDETLAAIRDADFDYQTGKLAEGDYHQIRARLDRRALEALDALERRSPGDAR